MNSQFHLAVSWPIAPTTTGGIPGALSSQQWTLSYDIANILSIIFECMPNSTIYTTDSLKMCFINLISSTALNMCSVNAWGRNE